MGEQWPTSTHLALNLGVKEGSMSAPSGRHGSHRACPMMLTDWLSEDVPITKPKRREEGRELAHAGNAWHREILHSAP